MKKLKKLDITQVMASILYFATLLMIGLFLIQSWKAA